MFDVFIKLLLRFIEMYCVIPILFTFTSNHLKSVDLKGVEYTGRVSVTKAHPKFGVRRCRTWNEMTHRKMPTDGGDHNYCRNPDGVQRAPFCWVAKGQPGPKYGFCDIPDCDITTTTDYPKTESMAQTGAWLKDHFHIL